LGRPVANCRASRPFVQHQTPVECLEVDGGEVRGKDEAGRLASPNQSSPIPAVLGLNGGEVRNRDRAGRPASPAPPPVFRPPGCGEAPAPATRSPRRPRRPTPARPRGPKGLGWRGRAAPPPPSSLRLARPSHPASRSLNPMCLDVLVGEGRGGGRPRRVLQRPLSYVTDAQPAPGEVTRAPKQNTAAGIRRHVGHRWSEVVIQFGGFGLDPIKVLKPDDARIPPLPGAVTKVAGFHLPFLGSDPTVRRWRSRGSSRRCSRSWTPPRPSPRPPWPPPPWPGPSLATHTPNAPMLGWMATGWVPWVPSNEFARIIDYTIVYSYHY